MSTPAHDQPPTEPGRDYGYDLAHEDLAAAPASVPPGPPGERPPAYVANETSDERGDYGYDLAHELRSAPER